MELLLFYNRIETGKGGARPQIELWNLVVLLVGGDLKAELEWLPSAINFSKYCIAYTVITKFHFNLSTLN